MRPRSLHIRLALSLLVLLALAGGLNLYSTLVTTELYLQEVNQNVNLDLAANIARMKHDSLLTAEGEVQSEGVEELLHWMMVVNPVPHFYLLDTEGNLLAYDPMAGEPQQRRVDLEPIRRFLEQRREDGWPGRTILGDDPREPGKKKVFSASPIPVAGPSRGFLYIVLGGQPLKSAAERLRSSYILRLSTRNALGYLAVVLLTGLLFFSRLTRRLRQLTACMREFHQAESEPGIAAAASRGDEIEVLDRTFDEMSRRIEHQMAEIERMARTRRELVANVSHDLRTPIASLRGYLETLALKRETLSGEEREEYLQIALRQSERLGELVDELFELTKLDAREIEPRPETLQFAELVQDNVQRFQLRAEEQGVRLGADFDPDLPAVLVDVALMERALENLIENAIRFTPSGGTVTVELEERSDRLRVRVVDTGSGIDEEDLPRILDRSYRSRSVASSKGAGLGLAITRRILELHGSELEIRSAPGRGTTVSFLLETVPRVSSRPDVAVPVAAGGSALSSAV